MNGELPLAGDIDWLSDLRTQVVCYVCQLGSSQESRKQTVFQQNLIGRSC